MCIHPRISSQKKFLDINRKSMWLCIVKLVGKNTIRAMHNRMFWVGFFRAVISFREGGDEVSLSRWVMCTTGIAKNYCVDHKLWCSSTFNNNIFLYDETSYILSAYVKKVLRISVLSNQLYIYSSPFEHESCVVLLSSFLFEINLNRISCTFLEVVGDSFPAMSPWFCWIVRAFIDGAKHALVANENPKKVHLFQSPKLWCI